VEGLEGRVDGGRVADQLELFAPDRLKVGEGLDALGRLDLERAAAVFERLVAEYPDAGDAVAWGAAARWWQEVFSRAEAMEDRERAVLLWESLKRCRVDRVLATGALRQAVVVRVVDLLERSGAVFVPPDLCVGSAYLEAGRDGEAEKALGAAVAQGPSNGALLGLHGDALWVLGRREEARAVYARALVTDPATVLVVALKDRELREIVGRWGAPLAPVWGWLAGVLPLLACGEPEAGEQGAGAVYRRLAATEAARRDGRHEAMVGHRPCLVQAGMSHRVLFASILMLGRRRFCKGVRHLGIDVILNPPSDVEVGDGSSTEDSVGWWDLPRLQPGISR